MFDSASYITEFVRFVFQIYNDVLPPYGMKAECRQFAVQTHHIDPHN